MAFGCFVQMSYLRFAFFQKELHVLNHQVSFCDGKAGQLSLLMQVLANQHGPVQVNHTVPINVKQNYILISQNSTLIILYVKYRY